MVPEGYQGELFEEFGRPRRKPKFLRKKRFPQRFFTLRLSQEKLVFSTIGLVVLLLVSFSLGVERGKKISGISQGAKGRLSESTPNIGDPGISKDKTGVEAPRMPQARIKSKEPKPSSATPEEEASLGKAQKSYPCPEGYAIQVATFKRKELAQRESKRLKLEGYNPFVLPAGRYFQVCVGPYSNKLDAATSLKKLKNQYRDCYLRRM